MSSIIETQVAQATKIAAQVMLEKLTARLSDAKLRAANAVELRKSLRSDNFNNFRKEIEELAEGIGSPSIEAAIALGELLLPGHEYANCSYNYNMGCLDRGDYYPSVDAIERVLNTGIVLVHAEYALNGGSCENQIRVEDVVEVSLPKHIVDVITEMEELVGIRDKANDEASSITDEILAVPTSMAKIEAQILTKELQKSDSGQAVLELTQSILSNTLDTGIKLLNK